MSCFYWIHILWPKLSSNLKFSFGCILGEVDHISAGLSDPCLSIVIQLNQSESSYYLLIWVLYTRLLSWSQLFAADEYEINKEKQKGRCGKNVKKNLDCISRVQYLTISQNNSLKFFNLEFYQNYYFYFQSLKLSIAWSYETQCVLNLILVCKEHKPGHDCLLFAIPTMKLYVEVGGVSYSLW